MTPRAARILQILEAERDSPPLSVEKIALCLKVTGAAGHDLTVGAVEAALAELMAAGQVERIWRRGAAHYRATVAAGETDRPLP